MITDLLAAAGEQPAGGAATGEIMIATVAAMIFTGGLVVLGQGHRNGKVGLLGWGANLAERTSGMPGWVALPSFLATLSLLTAVFGMYWDISLHIDVGRDEGPLANPAHYFILAGLFGIFAAGFVAMVLPKDEKVGKSAVRISRDWHAPLGGVIICACGAFSLIGFPLDDVWHRLFGQDVTLWGPTHLMLIGGAAMTLVGIAILQTEGKRYTEERGTGRPEKEWVSTVRAVGLTGGLLIGLATFQAEFDFGVPQFRLVFGPMLVMLAAGVGLVVARLWIGRGAALGAVAFFLAVRGGLALLVGPVLGETTPKFPLFLGCALVVEAIALLVPREKPLRFALWTGLGIGTVGLASEWAWSHVFMPIPWSSALFPEGALLGFAMAMAGALIGTWIATRLSLQPIERPPVMKPLLVGAAVLIAVAVSYSLYKPAIKDTSADVALTEVQGGPERTARAEVRFNPEDAPKDAELLNVTAWQGGAGTKLTLVDFEEVSPGVYRSKEAFPVSGTWKTLIRLHKGNTVSGLPLFLPEDPAIPAEEVPAESQFTRPFVKEHEILQREQKSAAGWLTIFSYGVVAAIALGLLTLLAWGLHRLAGAALGEAPTAPGARGGNGRFRRDTPSVPPRAPAPAARG